MSDHRHNQASARTCLPGKAAPLGASPGEQGVNFSLFSRHATAVELVFFNHVDDLAPSQTWLLEPPLHRTYHYWHICVPEVKPGQLYAWRVQGAHDPAQGHRFDKDKFLLDPYARAIAVPDGYDRKAFCQPGPVAQPCMKSVVVDSGAYDWEGDARPMRPFARTVIYEMHVGGFTSHPASGLPERLRGTYAGLVEKLPYLSELGITAIELLPVMQFDEQDAPNGLRNYWGYSPVTFFAPHMAYAAANDPLQALDEFRNMVKACHKAGIEVILDVVFNHTSEGNESGPTYCFRGIDNSVYYILEADPARYANYSGTGNTLNANHPVVRRMIIDSLHYWVREMHIDGFRFDLASILARDEKGRPLENPPVLWDIESDPELAGVKLIAEAWDAAGLYQVGSFIGDSWKEWNGRFRDDVRAFFRGDSGRLSAMASRLLGSPDIYGHEEREPEQSINFVTCHDGFTLNDLVSYNEKHNEDNGEQNRDGSNDNLSWNCGAEGPSDDPDIEQLRSRQIKNFLAVNLLALGTPMLLMGDEVRRTQLGNNNAYCHNNHRSWFNWEQVDQQAGLLRFVQLLVRARLQREASMRAEGASLNEMLRDATLQWHGVRLGQPDWSQDSHSIAVTIHSLSGALAMHLMINAWKEDLRFELPNNGGQQQAWRRWLDTALDPPNDILPWQQTLPWPELTYPVKSHSLAILVASLG
ncbi:MAG: glycogen debranching protein GlgX [Chitinophagaceae bacterium]|nr:glycogen debranching protein GlgX [Chitinophagaceae bacterium]